MRLKWNALKRWLGTAMVVTLVASTPAFAMARSTDSTADDQKPDITLYAQEYMWDLSTHGKVLVDGHFARIADRIPCGTKIFVDSQSNAKAEIRGVGRVTLAPRSEVVLDMVDNTLVARMIEGSMRLEVGARYSSYVETPDSKIVSYQGTFASYRVKADPLEGTTVDKSFGDVEILATTDSDKDGWDVDVEDEVHMKARDTETLKVKVKNSGSPVSNQPVVFAITTAMDGATGEFTEGVQRITTTTDNDGEARVQFKSGAATGQVYVEAFIPGTDARDTSHIHILAKEKTFWNAKTKALYIALGAGAVAGAIVAVENTIGNDDRNPVITPGPPTVSGP